ncbi:MAG: VanZ family protein [Desulfobacterales bacterium]
MLPRLMRMLPDLAPLIAYCTFIVIQSHLPSPVELPEVSHVDKLLHAGAYGVMAVLFYRTYRAGWPQAGRRALLWASVASAALFGLSDEIHQFFVPERTADPLDFLADAAGAFLGAALYQRLFDPGRRTRGPSARPRR